MEADSEIIDDLVEEGASDPYEHEPEVHHPWLDLDPDHQAATAEYEVTPHRILEAMLFVGTVEGEPLSSKKVASLMRGVRADEIEDFVRELNTIYDRDGCPYRIASESTGFRMEFSEKFLHIRKRFYGDIKEAELPQHAVDVLSLVAYRQPVTKDEIEELRGKQSGAILSQLVRRQLLQIERTDEKPRRTLYRTTDRFLNMFGIESLADLPSGQQPEFND